MQCSYRRMAHFIPAFRSRVVSFRARLARASLAGFLLARGGLSDHAGKFEPGSGHPRPGRKIESRPPVKQLSCERIRKLKMKILAIDPAHVRPRRIRRC